MAEKKIKLKVNRRTFTVSVKPTDILVDVLRDKLGLTGTKKSCGQGDCGACTVLMDGKAVNACLMLAMDAQGQEITTIEGLEGEDGTLHPLQEAFVENAAIQCGFCTPGMILSAKSLLDEIPHPTEEEVRQALSGNLCRCTGYAKIVQAVLDASGKMGGSERFSKKPREG
jgi:aerobic-type carbon monoxide dehydrogenase small subunit (CoxS/CutS family)